MIWIWVLAGSGTFLALRCGGEEMFLWRKWSPMRVEGGSRKGEWIVCCLGGPLSLPRPLLPTLPKTKLHASEFGKKSGPPGPPWIIPIVPSWANGHCFGSTMGSWSGSAAEACNGGGRSWQGAGDPGQCRTSEALALQMCITEDPRCVLLPIH